ncbi:MAG: hypothetical protein NT116_00640, partial [Candidatus Parcubacteria bacterium]|nr:hypothetical protein [Candidatus Parcubacteria bacterium]
MKKHLRKLIFLKIFGNFKIKLILGSLIFISIAFLGYSFLNFVKAANLNYSEDFTTTTLKNSLYTTANWLGTGFVDLSKAFVRAD